MSAQMVQEQTMARVTPFGSPFMLGFDDLEAMMESIGKSGSEGFPPYNIEQLDQATLRLSLALAGYSCRIWTHR